MSMDPNLRRTSSRWIIILILVASARGESRSVHGRGSGSANIHRSPTGTRSSIQPVHAPRVKHQPSAELSTRPRPVVVRCHPDSMEVVVQADMFDTGLQVDGRHVRLGPESGGGGGACSAVPSGAAEFTIRALLTDCGTKLSSTKEKIIYSTVLVYSPETSSDRLLRLDGATIPVECHYEKKYAVDSISLHPTWVPLVSRISAKDQIKFTLRVMSDDWLFERGSRSYFLGDPVRFEVSAIIGNHMPLRVYADHCVATATPDADATLRYDFIEHYGCLTDAYMTNCSSHFLPRVEDHKLRFQLDAFRFDQEPRNQVYITCYVKAVPVTLTVNSQNRACSLIGNRWQSVDGNDQACRSCDIAKQSEEPPPTGGSVGTKALSAHTFSKQESLVQNTHEEHPASYIHFRPGVKHSQQSQPYQSSARLMKRGNDDKAEKTMQLGPLIVLQSNKFESRPTDSKTQNKNA